MKKKTGYPDHCSKCLRNQKGICAAFTVKQWPCWAYIDDKNEFDRREKERKDFLENTVSHK
jgi:hypothetical protein